MRKYQKKVANGIRLLDSIFPPWKKNVDLNKLDMNDPNCCILAQAYKKPYFNALQEIGFKASRIDGRNVEHGFDLIYILDQSISKQEFQELTKEWKLQLSEVVNA